MLTASLMPEIGPFAELLLLEARQLVPSAIVLPFRGWHQGHISYVAWDIPSFQTSTASWCNWGASLEQSTLE